MIQQRSLLKGIVLFIFLYSLAGFSAEEPSLAKNLTIQLQTEVVEGQRFYNTHPRNSLWPIQSKKLPLRSSLPQFEDVLNATGALQARTLGSPTFSIRGSGQSGRVLSLFNGVPMNFATGFGAPTVLLPKEVIGEMSVVKGPSSLFYGSQALAGSIHFIGFKAERPELKINISDTDESFLPWKQSALSQNNWTLTVPFLKSTKSHHQISVFTEKDDGQFSFEANGKRGQRTFNGSNTSRVTLMGNQDFKKWSLDYNLIGGREIKQSPGPIHLLFETRQETEGYLVSIAPKFKMSPKVQLHSRLSYLNTNSDYQQTGLDSYFDQTTFIFQNELRYSRSRWNIQLFADYFNHSMDNTFFGRGLKEDHFEVAPLATYYFISNLYSQIGSRYIATDKKWISNLGLFYTPQPFSVWLNWSQGFRRPSLSDKFATTPFSIANPNLLPEQAQQYELGFRYQPTKPNITTFTHHFSHESRVFFLNYSEFFDNQQATPTQSQKVNRGSGDSYGLETSWVHHWGPWETSLHYNYLETKNKQTQQPFRLSPKNLFSLTIDHFLGPFRIRVQNVFWKTTFDRDLSGNLVQLPHWNQWNLEFHTYGFTNMNFSLGINNIFDASKQLTLNYPEPQRRYWAQMRYQF